MKNLIERVDEKLKSQSYINLEMAKNEISNSASGFYWIYTKLPMSRFSAAPSPSNRAHTDFSLLATIHNGLVSVISQSNKEHWCIYNGKGKQLKARMAAEFTNTKGKTGKLALLRCFQESDFDIKYIICESYDARHGITERYGDIERDLERVWRLNHGWPFLCRT
ncbi:MAG: hypothetical protein L6300_02585 [Syntrophaceae bacterium]|nr:hypothetical protein [Syntrophaceae bacterium]